MNKIKTKLQELGFTLNHAFIMLAAVFVFGLLVIPRTNISVSAMFSQAEEETQPMLTYDQVRNQVYADAGVIDEEQYQQELENQFALLDRGQADGAVLGAAIGLDEVPSAEQLFSQEQLDLISIKTVVPTNTQTIQNYADKILQIESYYDTAELFANLNSSDKALYAKTSAQAKDIIKDMSEIAVPTELVNYHKYNIFYYQTISKLAESFSGDDSGLAQYSSALFSLMDKISSIKIEIESKYQISL